MTRTAAAPLPPHQRSAVTNGSRVLVGVDGCSAQARRYKDLIGILAAEVGGGLTDAQHLQVRNAAALQLHAEELTAALVRGEPVNPEAITRSANGASRLIGQLIKAKASARKPKGDGVADYLAGKAVAA